MLDICVAIGIADHAAFLLLRTVSKRICDEYALLANMRLGVEDLLSRGDIISLMARNAEFVPDVARESPGWAIMLLCVDYARVWEKVAKTWPVLFTWMQNVVCAYWPADAVGAMIVTPIMKLRQRGRWRDKLAYLYDCLLDYSLRKGNTTVYHHIGRCRYACTEEYPCDAWGFKDFTKVRFIYMTAPPEFPRKYYELGAYILRTRPEVMKFINACWDCDEFVECCHEINSPTCKI